MSDDDAAKSDPSEVAEPTDSTDKNLLVRVRYGEAQSVSFHAVSAGTVLVTQAGEARAVPLDLPDDPIAAFQQAAPGIATPSVLSAATRSAAGDESGLSAATAGEPVIIDLPPRVLANAFPREQFICWARNRYSCVYDTTGFYDEYSGALRTQTYNSVWAVDQGWVVVKINLYYPNGSGGNYLGDVWQYETFENHWRTFTVSGHFAARGDANWSAYWYGQSPLPRPPVTRFHFSSAGAQ